MKTAFLILGAQRSGTSVTSHVLSRLGVNFGPSDHFFQDKHNPIFFELKWINQYNNHLIQELGHQYTDFFLPLEADYAKASIANLAAELPLLIQQEWDGDQTIGIKDPRFSLTFPIWEEALSIAGYALKIIFVFRCPGDFLQSNQTLFKDWEGWDEARHLRFWLQLNLTGIYFARNHPVHFISYDDLMGQPLETVQRLTHTFDLDTNQVTHAAAVVNNAYRHHGQSMEIEDPAIAHYYQRLRSHTLSAKDYLTYRRNQILGEAQSYKGHEQAVVCC